MEIRRGEFIVILGKSGSGKTTMLNIIGAGRVRCAGASSASGTIWFTHAWCRSRAGTIDRPTRGELCIAGVRVNSKTTDAAMADVRLRRIGFVFQTFNLLPAMTAIENVEMPMVRAQCGPAWALGHAYESYGNSYGPACVCRCLLLRAARRRAGSARATC